MSYSEVTHAIADEIYHNPDKIAIYPRNMSDDEPQWTGRFEFDTPLNDMMCVVSSALHALCSPAFLRLHFSLPSHCSIFCASQLAISPFRV